MDIEYITLQDKIIKVEITSYGDHMNARMLDYKFDKYNNLRGVVSPVVSKEKLLQFLKEMIEEYGVTPDCD